jgi:hypothetical protein
MQQAKGKSICPHCNLQTANEKVCTNLGCGKLLTAPVKLFARPRRRSALMPMLVFEKRSKGRIRPITVWNSVRSR